MQRKLHTYASYDFENWSEASVLGLQRSPLLEGPPLEDITRTGEEVHLGAALHAAYRSPQRKQGDVPCDFRQARAGKAERALTPRIHDGNRVAAFSGDPRDGNSKQRPSVPVIGAELGPGGKSATKSASWQRCESGILGGVYPSQRGLPSPLV